MKHHNMKKTAAALLVAFSVASVGAQAEVQLPAKAFQPAMSYSFALQGEQSLAVEAQKVETQSNEYWVTVGANELKAGVDIFTSQAGALIKISRSDSQTTALEPQSLKLFAAADLSNNIAGKVLGEQDLKTTGIFANATAIKMDKAIAPGQFKLQYEGALSKNAQFVIHVKEKGSIKQLHLATAKQHAIKGDNLTFSANMLSGQKTLNLKQVDAFIMSPSGKKIAVPAKRMANGTTQFDATEVTANLTQVEAPINGLYELHVNTVAEDKGLSVLRTGKIAFALAEQTATIARQLKQPISPFKPQANFELAINEPGRYEIRGTLYGHDQNGELKPIMETHAAKHFDSGKGILNMEFDRKLLIKSDLAAPFVIKNVRLYDQTRMSRL